MADETILLVDDEPDLLEIFSMELEFAGYNVKVASCGQEAFQKLQEDKSIKAVLSDIRMPNGDGLELLENIRSKNFCNPPLIFMSGYSDINNEEEALGRGAAGFFQKPVDGVSIVNAIDKAIIPKEKAWQKLPDNTDNAIFVKKEFKSIEDAESSNEIKIGHGGIFIQNDNFTGHLHSLVSFEVRFSDQFLLKGFGKVKWHRKNSSENKPSGIGIEIEFLEDTSLSFYNQLVSRKMPISYIPA